MERVFIRFPNWVGDVVMATSFLTALQKQCPDCDISIALRPHLIPLLWGALPAENILPVIRPDEHRIFPLVQWKRRLQSKSFDAAFILPPSFSSALAPFAARIPIRAGWAANGRSPLLTHAVERIRPIYAQRMLDQYASILTSVLPDAEAAMPPPKLKITFSHQELARQALERCGLENLRRPVVIMAASGARGPAKRYIPSRFAAVADALHKKFGGSFILAGGGPGDADDLNAVAGYAGDSIRGIMLGEKTNGLAELMGLLAEADLVIGNDTGTLHVAGALGKPVVAVFGSTSPVWTPPLGPDTTILYKPAACSPCYRQACRYDRHWCMENVSVQDVLEAAEKKLQAVQG